MKTLMGALTLLMATSCGSPVSFTVTQTSDSQVQPCPLGVVSITGLGFAQFADIKLTETTEFKNNGVRAEDLESVKLQSLDLRVVNPAGTELGYLDSVSFFAEAPGQPRVLVADHTGFPAGHGVVQFDVKDVNLQPYLAAEKFTMTTEIVAHGCPFATQDLRATAVFAVEGLNPGLVGVFRP